MSTLTSILNSAITSMQANQLGIAVASNNMANAQNPEFTRQRLVTVPGASLDEMHGVGSGVEVVRVEAIRDQLIEIRRLQEHSSLAGDDLLNRTLSDIEVQFTDTDDTGLLQVFSQFFNSFQTLSTDPASTNFRQQVLSKAQSLIDNFKTLNDSLKNAQSLLNRSVTQKVATVNSLASQIARISGLIANQEVNGPANDLRDQRAGLVKQLSAIAEVHELETADKFYQLTVGNNRLLVFGTQTAPLSTTADANGFTRVTSGGDDITDDFKSGELAASFDVRDNYIPKYLNSLDQMAYEIAEQVNLAHSAGYDLNGNTGLNFFEPLAGVAGASRLLSLSVDVAGNTSAIAASGQATGQDNETAMLLGNLLFQPVFTGGSISDQYRNLVFGVGSDVSNSAVSLQEHEALAEQLELRRQSMSGVSIDEETLQILQFQRAYQASARLIKTVDELTQTILNI